MGVRFALARSRSLPERTWIANTDADTLVPRDWLVRHHRLGSDHDLVLGTVRPTITADNTERLQLWSTAYMPDDGHHHVHGANLGIRGALSRRRAGSTRASYRESPAGGRPLVGDVTPSATRRAQTS